MGNGENFGNIFSLPQAPPAQEFIETLVVTEAFTLERIISEGHATPEGEWYDQERDEWVVLLSGSAGLRFAHDDKVVEMRPGDYVLIPAHVRHRVEWTDARGKTFWLAIHFRHANSPLRS